MLFCHFVFIDTDTLKRFVLFLFFLKKLVVKKVARIFLEICFIYAHHTQGWLTFKCIMPENGNALYRNHAEFAAIFLKCVWPFRDIMH